MKYVLDTNVLSEITKAIPNPQCVAWLASHRTESCITTISLAELRYGMERLPDGKRKRVLAQKYEHLRQYLRDWILEFDETAASEFGRYVAEFEMDRGELGVLHADIRDLQIAAIARSQGFTVATRNEKHFPFIATVNPFT
jgi:predicted nucleic acid-binding protein